ncbi:hypothetical protein X275_00690 [Marinitoga sp. 1197]|uniref:hypothetical protein n=1 Tax=Marinitoga sp. 1197 TaxID=1428449 RepID=UPI000640BDB7|nr:hypothetical protein [Marinitoga sp. 1197]KLO24234.1 hypothetical protein X275_00690 [Marinitoga sp. 1197]
MKKFFILNVLILIILIGCSVNSNKDIIKTVNNGIFYYATAEIEYYDKEIAIQKAKQQALSNLVQYFESEIFVEKMWNFVEEINNESVNSKDNFTSTIKVITTRSINNVSYNITNIKKIKDNNDIKYIVRVKAQIPTIIIDFEILYSLRYIQTATNLLENQKKYLSKNLYYEKKEKLKKLWDTFDKLKEQYDFHYKRKNLKNILNILNTIKKYNIEFYYQEIKKFPSIIDTSINLPSSIECEIHSNTQPFTIKINTPYDLSGIKMKLLLSNNSNLFYNKNKSEIEVIIEKNKITIPSIIVNSLTNETLILKYEKIDNNIKIYINTKDQIKIKIIPYIFSSNYTEKKYITIENNNIHVLKNNSVYKVIIYPYKDYYLTLLNYKNDNGTIELISKNMVNLLIKNKIEKNLLFYTNSGKISEEAIIAIYSKNKLSTNFIKFLEFSITLNDLKNYYVLNKNNWEIFTYTYIIGE